MVLSAHSLLIGDKFWIKLPEPIGHILATKFLLINWRRQMLTILSYIFTFGVLLSFFVIAMFILIDRLYPAEEAITDTLEDMHKRRRINLLNETLSRGVPEYTLVQGWDSVENAKQTTDDLPEEDIDEEWIDYHDVVKK